MKYFPENYYLIVVGFFVSFNAFATKIAPVSIEELVSDSSMISVVDVKQANLSTEQYEVIYSGKKKNYLNYVATIIDPIKEGEKGKTVKFLGREPLLVSQKYLIFLTTSKSGHLFVAQAGYAALENSHISFESGVKEGVRVPLSYISLSKKLISIPGVTKLNEQAPYVWVDWLLLKSWMKSNLSPLYSVK